MKKFTLALLAATAIAAVAPAGVALAQPGPSVPWASINDRRADMERRIDQGVRSGALTQAEAQRLRAEFRSLVQLEAQYRRSGNGMNAQEKADLNRRYDILSAKVRSERNDQDDRNWRNINQRQAELDRRIDMGVRNGTLTRAEAVRLRAEFQQIARLEAQYRRSGNGLTRAERLDLDRRFDILSRKIQAERADTNEWYGSSNRLAELSRRIEAGIQRGQITRAEAAKLRSEHRYLVQLEQNYRRGGLTARERQDLNRRFELLAAKIRWERRDWENRRY